MLEIKKETGLQTGAVPKARPPPLPKSPPPTPARVDSLPPVNDYLKAWGDEDVVRNITLQKYK